MIKLNDFQKQWLDIEDEMVESFKSFGRSGWYILGDGVRGFEAELVKYYPDNKYAIGCASGLDAIEISLKALGIKKGDVVLTTPLSAFATTLAIIKTGAIPAFVDITDNGLINLDLAEKFFQENPNSKYFVPVHLYGHSLDLVKLKELKSKYNLKIVEDCAQAILAKSGKLPVGSVGDLSATSFYPTKNLGCFGDGGAILTSNENYNETCRAIRDYGQTSKYHHSILGMNSRLDELQAVLMKNVLLPKLQSQTEHRQKIAKIYLNGIKNKHIHLSAEPKNSISVYHLFPVLTKHRDSLKEHLKQHNIESNVHYPILITDQEAIKNSPHFIFGNLDTAKSFVNDELSLPINSTILPSEAEEVVKACNSWTP